MKLIVILRQPLEIIYQILNLWYLWNANKEYKYTAILHIKSKETYRQTRGLSNLEMKHVGELAITGVFLKAVKKSWVRTTQGRNYLTKRRLFSLAFGAHISQNS